MFYQNYDIQYKANVLGADYYFTGRLASFVGFSTYIKSYPIASLSETVNANRAQGYWSFESNNVLYNGQAPATTVPNPIAATSPIPLGSCVVTGQFANNLLLTGNETNDVVIEVSLSTNNSFELEETDLDSWH